MNERDAKKANQLLTDFLRAADEDKMGRLKERLQAVTDPIMRKEICRKLRVPPSALEGGVSTPDGQEAPKLFAEVRSRLWSRLNELKGFPAAEPIKDLCAYVRQIARNTCNTSLQERYPALASLAGKVRLVLENRTPQTGFAIWKEGPDVLTGFQVWHHRGLRLRRGHRYQEILAQPGELTRALAPITPPEMPLPALLAALFDHVKEPIEWGDLIDILRELLGVHKFSHYSGEDDTSEEDPIGRIPGRLPDPEDKFVRGEVLRKLWRLIGRLRLVQRQSLLLNLRDDDGGCTIDLFPTLGIATVREIGDLLEIPYEEFRVLWGELPLEDKVLANRLGKTPEHIRKLRCMARKCLEQQLPEADRVQ